VTIQLRSLWEKIVVYCEENKKQKCIVWALNTVAEWREVHSKKTDDNSFERLEDFKYLEETLTNQYSIQKEIISRLKSGNGCYLSVQNIFFSSLLSKNLKIKKCRIIILPVARHGFENWSLTLRQKRRLRVFESRVLRRTFASTRDEVTGEWRKLHNGELNDLFSLLNIVRVIKPTRMRWAGHVARLGRDAYTGFQWGILRERDQMEDPGKDG